MPDAAERLDREHIDADRLTAGLDMLRRTGAIEVQIRYSDDEEPTVWFVVAKYRVDKDGKPAPHGAGRAFDTASGADPLQALERLLELMVDGATCKHCDRPSAVESEWRAALPMAEMLCWYVYDPSTKKYVRSCAGDEPIPTSSPS